MTESTKESKGGKVVAFTVLGVLALGAAGYVGAYAAAGAKVPRGTSVAGVEIGGLERHEAVAKVEEDLGSRKQVKVSIDGTTTQLATADLGISVDAAASVAEAGGGRSWSPERLWNYYTGGDDVDPVITEDTAALDAVLDSLDEKYGTAPVDGTVVFRRGQLDTTEAETGRAVDREEAREELTEALLSGDVAELELVTAEPEIDGNDVQKALDEFANPAVSAAVTLVFDKTPIRLSPAEYSAALSMVPEDGVLVPELDEARLEKVVRAKFVDDDAAPVDATVKLVKGKPRVVPSRPGVDFTPEDISATFLDLVVQTSGARKAEVKATVRDADFTTADAKALGIKEKVSTFTTYYPPATYRNVNIGRAAELIDGTVLKPGETFSLNDTVGERTVANGFTSGYMIADGVLKQDLGGGVSQMATTTFNAAFFAGLEDVEHKAHSLYFDRYPVGREATVAWGAVDLKFKNDTDHGILISAKVTPGYSSNGVVTVSMYGTKVWDITTKTGARYNYRAPGTRYLQGEGCEPNNAPASGFDIDVWRYFHKPGSKAVEKTEKFHTSYIANDKVVCGPPPGEKKKDAKTDD